MTNQFEERLGGPIYLSQLNDGNMKGQAFPDFMKEVLGYPVKAVLVAWNAAWAAGLSDYGDRYVPDFLWAIDVTNQDEADLLNYLSSGDKTEYECRPGGVFLVSIPGYDYEDDEDMVPCDVDLTVMSKGRWDSAVRHEKDRVRKLHAKIEDKIAQCMHDVKGMPDYSPKEEDAI